MASRRNVKEVSESASDTVNGPMFKPNEMPDELRVKNLVQEITNEDTVPEIAAFKLADEKYFDFMAANSTMLARLEDLAHERERCLDAVEALQKATHLATPTFPLAREPSRGYDADALAAWVTRNNELLALKGRPIRPIEQYGLSLRPASYAIDTTKLYTALAAKLLPMDVVLVNSKPVFAYRRHRRLDLAK